MKQKTILIVDDTVTNLDILSDLLEDYDVVDALNGFDALEIINNEHIDLILLDIMMPDMDGFEVCTKIKSNKKTKNIPIIFITAMTDEDSIEKAYEIGANDYVTKPFKPKELLAKVKREFEIQELIAELKNSEEELKLLASTDSLTKLYNRRYFTEASHHIFTLTQRNQEKVSIIILDIDKFKFINDTYGHKVGDEVIISLSNALMAQQRKSDIICRFGGEEFVILLPQTSKDGAITAAENIRKNIENLEVKVNNQIIKYTISIGVSEIDYTIDSSVEHALQRADKALYTAKESGRNQVQSL